MTHIQPPKRRAAPQASSSSPATASTKKARQSKLAKENDLSAEEENEIKEAFHIFSQKDSDGEFKDEKEGVISRGDVRKALV